MVIETIASPAGLQDAFASVRRGGCVVLVGGFREPLSLDLKRVVDNEIRIFGSLCYSTSGMKRAFEVAADKDTGSIKVQICQTL